MERKCILCADSDQNTLDLLSDSLGDAYDIEIALTGVECLSKFAAVKPDVVLLDVDLADLDGYEICARIRSLNQRHDIPILFFSEHCEVEDMLNGYEAGGDDYIHKPYDIKVVRAKINTHLVRFTHAMYLRDELEGVTTTAINALINTNELGVLVSFTDECLYTQTHDDLIRVLFKALKSYGLAASAQVRTGNKSKIYSMQGDLAPIEKEIFNVYIEGEAVIHFSNKSMLNRDHVSLLIKNMPVDNKVVCDRITEHLSIIANCTDARLKAIHIEQNKAGHLRNLSQAAIDDIRGDIRMLEGQFKEFGQASREIMEALTLEMDRTLFALCLNEEQEEQLHEMIAAAQKDLNTILKDESEMDLYFEGITQKITNALDF